MRKRYIPPRQRRVWQRVRISTAGLFLTTLSFLGLVSLVSLVQTSFYTAPAQAQTEPEISSTVISDAIVAKKGDPNQNSNQAAQRISVNIDLSNLPLERVWPIRGNLTTYYSGYHPAIDIAAPRGTPIHPFATGVVVSAGWQGSFGRAVTIAHSNGFETTYAHMNTIAVGVGQTVSPSDVIGQVGSTGRSTGPHLHFQLTQNGRYINPLSALP